MIENKTISNSQFFLKYAIYVLLIGQLWNNIDTCIHFNKIGSFMEYVFIDDLENDADNELDFEKLFKDRISNPTIVFTVFQEYDSKNNFSYKDNLLPVNHLEIHTPPPEYS